MEQDLAGARRRETSLRQRLSRRMNWLCRTWYAFSDAVVAAVRALVPDAFEADGGVS
jgi:hypothetical protein